MRSRLALVRTAAGALATLAAMSPAFAQQSGTVDPEARNRPTLRLQSISGVQYALTTQFNVSTFVQYNTSADEIVSNVRADFIHAPLSDLFLLFTERRSANGGGVLERFVTVKVTRLLLF